MARFSVEVRELTELKGGALRAEGTLTDSEAGDDVEAKAFVAQTIQYGPRGAKKSIFKVEEEGGLACSLAGSAFTRGERIALARSLKNYVADEAARSDLNALTLKDLRSLAKAKGVSGTHRKGITKAEVVELVRQAS